jgi:hypothetical protein
MPIMGANDQLKSKPKFDKERTVHGLVNVSVLTTANSPTNSIVLVANNNLAVGYVAASANIGNVFGSFAFNEVGPTITAITTGATITLSNTTGNNIPSGTVLTFAKPIKFKPNTLANTYNANTYFVTAGRLANTHSLLHNNGVGQGWVYVVAGTGFVKSAIINNGGLGISNGSFTIAANTTYPGGSGAVVSYTVNVSGAIVSTNVQATGSGYVVTPTLTQVGNSTVTLVMGGRANRITTELLSAIGNSAIVASDVNSGGLWFPGT